MTYDELKIKYPDLNWEEAEEASPEDLEAAAESFDRLILKLKNGKHNK